MRRIVAASTLALLFSLAGSGAAQAGVLTASAGECATPSLSQVFLPWSDVMSYTAAPGSAAESTDGWASLSGASVADGNEPWQVSGDGSHNLRLPAGSSATTDTMCVGVEYPTIRFFAKSAGTGLLSSLRVDATVETSLGLTLTVPVGFVAPGGSWHPTLPMVVVANLLPLLPGDLTPVRFSFTPQGSG